MRVLLVATSMVGSLAIGCVVSDIDLSHRACRSQADCIAGWTCVDSICVTESSGSGGEPSSCGVGGDAFFDEEFDGDLSKWSVNGGTWAIKNGSVEQTNATAATATLLVQESGLPTDYRLVTRARQASGSASGALELTFRVSTSPATSQYLCNWQPNDGYLYVAAVENDYPKALFVNTAVPLPPDYDPLAQFTLEARIEGSALRCRVCELPDADFTVPNAVPALSGSAFGLKTFQMAGAFDYLRAFPP
jgi:hypothetical protein